MIIPFHVGLFIFAFLNIFITIINTPINNRMNIINDQVFPVVLYIMELLFWFCKDNDFCWYYGNPVHKKVET